MLSGKDKRYLRSMAMTMDAVVQVGKGGVNESVLFSLNEALDARELVKIKVLKNCFDEMNEVAAALEAQADCEIVQVIGRNIIVYRKNPNKKGIVLPE